MSNPIVEQVNQQVCCEQDTPTDAEIVVDTAGMPIDLASRPAEVILSAFGQPGHRRDFSERVLYDVAGEIGQNSDYFKLLTYEQARTFVGQLVARGIELVWQESRKRVVR